jgi:hypothetical protein
MPALNRESEFSPTYGNLPPREIFVFANEELDKPYTFNAATETPAHDNLSSKAQPEHPCVPRVTNHEAKRFTFEGFVTPASSHQEAAEDNRDAQEDTVFAHAKGHGVEPTKGSQLLQALGGCFGEERDLLGKESAPSHLDNSNEVIMPVTPDTLLNEGDAKVETNTEESKQMVMDACLGGLYEQYKLQMEASGGWPNPYNLNVSCLEQLSQFRIFKEQLYPDESCGEDVKETFQEDQDYMNTLCVSSKPTEAKNIDLHAADEEVAAAPFDEDSVATGVFLGGNLSLVDKMPTDQLEMSALAMENIPTCSEDNEAVGENSGFGSTDKKDNDTTVEQGVSELTEEENGGVVDSKEVLNTDKDRREFPEKIRLSLFDEIIAAPSDELENRSPTNNDNKGSCPMDDVESTLGEALETIHHSSCPNLEFFRFY